MAKFAKKKVSQQQAQKNIFDATALDAITELLQSPKKLFWLNFRTGFTRGFAGVLGAAVAIVAVGIIVALFGGLPYVGSFLQKIGEAIQSK
ncbi:hypothetical protein H0W80_00850 [Candidatus Saccharibacteria bacterium]|nr:hypothetical protein [Candidatus Saccharibacteria bacterium]